MACNKCQMRNENTDTLGENGCQRLRREATTNHNQSTKVEVYCSSMKWRFVETKNEIKTFWMQSPFSVFSVFFFKYIYYFVNCCCCILCWNFDLKNMSISSTRIKNHSFSFFFANDKVFFVSKLSVVSGNIGSHFNIETELGFHGGLWKRFYSLFFYSPINIQFRTRHIWPFL